MKAIMYHYVRESRQDLPYFRYLHRDDFEKQLDYFTKEFGFVTRDGFYNALKAKKPLEGVLLSFDDGLADHYDYVFPILKKRGLWGTFFLSSGPYKTQKLLDVHRVHLLLGRLGGDALLQKIENKLTHEMLIDGNMERFSGSTYLQQSNDEPTTRAKQIINFYMKPEYKDKVLEDLIAQNFGEERRVFEEFYLKPDQIKEMAENGMSVGSHASTHTLLSNLSPKKQKQEIEDSYEFLKALCGDAYEKSFCYPYGGSQSFTADTQEILRRNKVLYALSVEPRDIDTRDLEEKYALPRYDCNMFKFGQARLG